MLFTTLLVSSFFVYIQNEIFNITINPKVFISNFYTIVDRIAAVTSKVNTVHFNMIRLHY